jgi:protein CpxP
MLNTRRITTSNTAYHPVKRHPRLSATTRRRCPTIHVGVVMRKMALFVVLAAVVSAGAVQAQGTGTPPARARGEGRGPGGRGGPGMEQALFRGITLTDAQKTRLEDMRKAERAQMQANGGARGGGDFAAMRTARENGDTATANRLMREQRTKMEARRDQQVSTIRGLLTSDQVSQFDANVADMKKREADMAARGFGGGRGRGGRPPQQ